MGKQRVNKTSLAIGSSIVLAAILGSTLLSPRVRDWIQQDGRFGASVEEDLNQPSAVLSLVTQPAEARRSQLEEIASARKRSLDRSRARYLLAVDLLAQFKGGPALEQLEGLEKEYPALAPFIMLKRGRGYELTNEIDQAQAQWKEVVETEPDAPIAGEALYLLGRSSPEPDYWNRMIDEFPAHPRTHEVARQRLEENPDDLSLLLLLAKYDADAWDVRAVRDRLVKEYAAQLTTDDWQAIADGYWEQWAYDKAAQAYAQAPRTPQNLYRLARSLQVEGNQAKAQAAYGQLIEEFPNAPDTGLGLRRLASLSPRKEALLYLERAIVFPDEAPEALLEKATILDALGSGKSAAEARQTLLDNYPNSEAAAEYRWSVAQKLAQQGNLPQAWQWAQAVSTHNPDSSLAPRAAFWVGKWAQQLGLNEDAEAAFEHVLAHHPESYYAWRSAVLLGWDVGDFTTVRQLIPSVEKPATRVVPPTGSDAFKELYRLGQDADAWNLFEAEINDEELTIDEQFTDGLLLLSKGQYLQGINRIWSLQERTEPEQKRQWQQLRQTPEYWYALFPFPFNDLIINWSKERQLNPLLVTSLIRQESRFEPGIQSPVGATGLMQVMPETGKWVADQLDLKDYSLSNPEDNVKLGTWYFDYTHQEYDNNSLFAVASYNAGPGNVSKWKQQYSFADPDVFIENIPFPETKGYVESVFGNYWNYLRIYNPEVSKALSRYTQADQ